MQIIFILICISLTKINEQIEWIYYFFLIFKSIHAKLFDYRLPSPFEGYFETRKNLYINRHLRRYTYSYKCV